MKKYLLPFATTLLLGLLFSGCASVQEGTLYSPTPHTLTEVRVVASRANFGRWSAFNDIPVKLGKEIADALNQRGIKASFAEATAFDAGKIQAGSTNGPGSVMHVRGESIGIISNQYGNDPHPDGSSSHAVTVYEGVTGVTVAEYKLLVNPQMSIATPKDPNANIRKTAQDFVTQSINAKNQLVGKAH